MLLQIIVSLVVLVGSYLVHTWYIKPKKQIAQLIKVLKSHKLTVVKLPYRMFGNTIYDKIAKDQKKLDDGLYSFKQEYSDVDVIVGNLLNRPNICVSNMEMLKELFSQDNVLKHKKEKKIAVGFWSIFSKGLPGIQGNQWKQRRRILSKSFNHEGIKEHFPFIINLADKTLQDFEKQAIKGTLDGKTTYKGDLTKKFVRFSSSGILSRIIGLGSLKENESGKNIIDLIHKFCQKCCERGADTWIQIFGETLLKTKIRKSDRQFVELQTELHNELTKAIHELEDKLRTENKDSEESKTRHKSLMENLIQEKNEGKLEYELIEQALIDEIKTFVIAADSTSGFLTSIFFHMFEKPDIVKKLKAEIDKFIKSDQDITSENLKNMTYLEAVILENSRIYNPAANFFQRQLSQDVNLNGMTLNKGLLIDVIFINRAYDPKTFENPHEFIPERWLSEESKKKLQIINMIFSTGPRNCIGKSFGLTNIKIMTIKFMKRYAHVIQEGTQEGKRRHWTFSLLYKITNGRATLIPEGQ